MTHTLDRSVVMTDSEGSAKGKGPRGRLPKNEGNKGTKKVSDEVMTYLVSEGYTGPEIVQVLKDDYGVDYTRSAVSYWRQRHNVPLRKRTKTTEKLIPWRILQQDSSHRLLKFLRTEARIREGLPVDRSNAFRHAAVANELRSVRGVVYYDRENGFLVVPPRPGIDRDVIFDPRFADDGSPVRDRALWQ